MRPAACFALVMVAVAAGVLSRDAAASPSAKPVAGYCSPSGDLCFGIFDRGGAVYLELSTFERYFRRYRLCVRTPKAGAKERCGSFPILRRGRVWASTVKYGRRFPVNGRGTYRVTWRLGARPLGPTLRFRLPLSS